MRDLRVGDRVVVNIKGSYNYCSKVYNGLKGTIKSVIEDNEPPLGVEFDEYIDGHSIDGLGKNGYCYYLCEEDLELIEDESEENKNFSSEDIQITSETTVTLTILEDEYELTEEDARYILQELQKALGEDNEN